MEKHAAAMLKWVNQVFFDHEHLKLIIINKGKIVLYIRKTSEKNMILFSPEIHLFMFALCSVKNLIVQ